MGQEVLEHVKVGRICKLGANADRVLCVVRPAYSASQRGLVYARSSGLGVCHSAIPVSYTHLTLPTKA